jgi:hypothetical protein
LLKYLRIIKARCFPLLLSVALAFLTISGFNKSYIPIITKDSGTALAQGCHEQADHSAHKKLVLDDFEKSEDEDCCGTICCCCCSTNLRSNLKFVLVKSCFINPDLKAAFFRNSENLIFIKNTFGAFGNKSPPTYLS